LCFAPAALVAKQTMLMVANDCDGFAIGAGELRGESRLASEKARHGALRVNWFTVGSSESN
jgi:hypothetical protein